MSHLQKSKHKDAEISKLQAALRLFINSKASQEFVEVDNEQGELVHSGGEDEEMDVDADSEKDDEQDDQEQGEDDEPLKPLFDDQTGLYFCTDCLAEIEEGFCMLCGDKYEWQEASIFPTYNGLEIKHVLTGRPFEKLREHGKSGHSL